MKSLYYLPFIAIFLVYSAYTRGLYSDLSQWKLIAALVLLIIPGAYWIYTKTAGGKRK